MWKFLFFFALTLSFAPQLLEAQTFSVIGYVRDAESGEPLEGAFVASPGTAQGTYANEEGLFILTLESEKRTEVVVKYLGYKVELLQVDPTEGKTWEVDLIPDEITLKPTVITGQTLRRIYPDPTIYIKDYAFWEDRYLLVLFDPEVRRNKLVLLDEELNLIDEHFGLGEEPISLHTDCLGQKHFLTKSHACQIDRVDDEWIIQKTDKGQYERAVLPCRAKVEETYFFEDPRGQFATGFYFVNEKVGVKEGFYWTEDAQSITTLKDEGQFYKRMATLQDYFPSQQQAAFQMKLNDKYLEAVQCTGSYAPLFRIGDDLIIFDHNRDHILNFDEGAELKGAVNIQYNEERSWEQQILVDEEQTRAFTLFDRAGMITIGEINLEDGTIQEEWELPKRFVTKIKVKGDEIYFLYKDNNYDPVNRLYVYEMDSK